MPCPCLFTSYTIQSQTTFHLIRGVAHGLHTLWSFGNDHLSNQVPFFPKPSYEFKLEFKSFLMLKLSQAFPINRGLILEQFTPEFTPQFSLKHWNWSSVFLIVCKVEIFEFHFLCKFLASQASKHLPYTSKRLLYAKDCIFNTSIIIIQSSLWTSATRIVQKNWGVSGLI